MPCNAVITVKTQLGVENASKLLTPETLNKVLPAFLSAQYGASRYQPSVLDSRGQLYRVQFGPIQITVDKGVLTISGGSFQRDLIARMETELPELLRRTGMLVLEQRLTDAFQSRGYHKGRARSSSTTGARELTFNV